MAPILVYVSPAKTHVISRGGAVVARQAHNLKVVGSIPTPVTIWLFKCGCCALATINNNRTLIINHILLVTTSLLELVVKYSKPAGLTPESEFKCPAKTKTRMGSSLVVRLKLLPRGQGLDVRAIALSYIDYYLCL